ncbi:hypothetical protein QWY16_18085 [Planococcus shenhongbingii]|uniref:Uncharacterized protein n=1 Tax=Planococcus shenhongbingii TaxID=3058398 RepID=A0ABT8NBK9_9BACL|nr:MULTISPECIES: hypothetical protein [unclassified Planococcus (in: firmicutes)]MDN7245276.1 hypothetical protein [Planococcus sp. N017]WKA58383.1 hypothetical protein QWY16_18085 [Planococcus sp. N016]
MEQTLWFIYAALLGTTTIGFLIHSRHADFPIKFDLAVSIVTWIGLFGFVTNNQILDPLVWKIVFFGALLWDILFAFKLKNKFEAQEPEAATGVAGTLFMAISTIILLGPLYYGLFQYAF